MIINGKEIKLRYSVRARLRIAKLCPGGKFENIGDLFGGSDEDSITALVNVGKLLNSEYERNARRERGETIEEDADYSVFEVDDVFDLPYETLSELESLITQTIIGDSKTTVESKPGKKKQGKI